MRSIYLQDSMIDKYYNLNALDKIETDSKIIVICVKVQKNGLCNVNNFL